MPPYQAVEPTGPLYEGDEDVLDTEQVASKNIVPEERKHQLVWRNIIIFIVLHLGGLYGLYLCFTSAKWQSTVFAFYLHQMAGAGITAGAHRLWSHRCYKAKWPLRAFLTMCHTLAFQDSVIDWARDHRVHHKYSGTDADPHNAARGFFFSHIGWLLVRKHPEVRIKGKGIDLSDLYADPFLRFQKKYYLLLVPIFWFLIPITIPCYYWGESLKNSWFVCVLLRYCWNLNTTWLVNSAAHMYGDKPYDKNIIANDNLFVAVMSFGEGWHNYHHTFPWDYKTAELVYTVNFTTLFLNLCAKLGLAYDLKTVPEEIVKRRVLRTGDGSHHEHHGTWGWGDKDQTQEERIAAIIIAPKNE